MSKALRGEVTRDEAKHVAEVVCKDQNLAFSERFVIRRGWRTWMIHPAADIRPTGPWIYISARNREVRRVDHDPPTERRLRWSAVAAIAVVIVALIGAFYSLKVCDDQQISNSEKVVTVCRHLQATDPPVIALAVVIVAALGVFFSEVSLPGLALKGLNRRVAEIAEVAGSAQQLGIDNEKLTTSLKETAEDLADFNERFVSQGSVSPRPRSPGSGAAGWEPKVVDLAARYNTLRGTMPSGDKRTAEMTKIIEELRQTLHGVRDFDVVSYLTDADRGMRLAAYAYLMENP
jgi:hypothetical protein